MPERAENGRLISISWSDWYHCRNKVQWRAEWEVRGVLKKVSPYRQSGAERGSGVHHDRSDCPNGSRIHSDEMVAGTGGLPICEECQALDRQDSVPTAR